MRPGSMAATMATASPTRTVGNVATVSAGGDSLADKGLLEELFIEEPDEAEVALAALPGPERTQPASGATRLPATAPRVTSPASRTNPIDEWPEGVWYVRPPSGGQYGPAKGDVMRGWLSEGRVSADSLVWREGWTDWQLAGPVFPELEKAYIGKPTGSALTNTSSPAVAIRTEGETRPSGLPLAAVGAKQRASGRHKPLAAVVVLTLLVVGLVAGLIAVLTMKPM
ncbi:MAG: DUF4339 domain-containing protein [Pirellulaceae bacterium]